MLYDLIVCGGTFDRFHKGHEDFLMYALSKGKNLLIGLTSDQYVQKTKPIFQVESYEIRKKNLDQFLVDKKVQSRVKIVEINDLFGPTLSKDLSIDAILVTKETLEGARIININRLKNNLSEIEIIVKDLVKDQNDKPISSSDIRMGKINREGKSYVNPLWFKKDLVLAQSLRNEFKEPFGKLFKDISLINNFNPSRIISVGDVTTGNFNREGIGQKISIIDFKVAREEKFSYPSELGFTGKEKIIKAYNPSGHITSDLFSKIVELFELDNSDRIVLEVKGEEDLAVLPLVLAAPLRHVIYYGQPGQGIVELEVTEESKKKAYKMVSALDVASFSTRGY